MESSASVRKSHRQIEIGKMERKSKAHHRFFFADDHDTDKMKVKISCEAYEIVLRNSSTNILCNSLSLWFSPFRRCLLFFLFIVYWGYCLFSIHGFGSDDEQRTINDRKSPCHKYILYLIYYYDFNIFIIHVWTEELRKLSPFKDNTLLFRWYKNNLIRVGTYLFVSERICIFI